MLLRPRRSVLYMPGSNQRALEKAPTLPADVLVLDLEDSVGPEKKEQARRQVITALHQDAFGTKEIVVRSNSLSSDWGSDDVKAIALSGANALCLPKVETVDEVQSAIALLNEAGAPKTMQLWAMIETPLGVININQLAAVDGRLTVLVMGTTDLAKELRVPHTPDRIGLQYALSQCVMAARANNKDILDGVYLDLQDQAGFANACEQGRELGFDGKTLIHPNQLAVANEVFGPAEVELQHAVKIIHAYEEAEAQGKGVVVVDGKLVEGMHVDEAKRQLAIAESIAELEADNVKDAG